MSVHTAIIPRGISYLHNLWLNARIKRVFDYKNHEINNFTNIPDVTRVYAPAQLPTVLRVEPAATIRLSTEALKVLDGYRKR